jgi:hypothetical protein
LRGSGDVGIPGVYGGGQAIATGPSPFPDVIGVGELVEGQDWCEDLLDGQDIGVCDPDEQGRGEEGAS